RKTPWKQQLSVAKGVPNAQDEPHSTVRFVGQVITGGVVSTTVTDWLQLAVKPLQSLTCQVRVITCGQKPLVEVFRIVSVMFVPQQGFVARGSSKFHAEPHSTVLAGGQMIVPGGQGLFVVVVSLNAMLSGTPCRSNIGVQFAGNGALPQTATSL